MLLPTCTSFPSDGTWLRPGNKSTPFSTPPCCSWDFPDANPAWCDQRPSEPVMRGDALHRGSASGALSGGYACTCARKVRDLHWGHTNCRLREHWNATRFCETLAGRRLLFVGDSTMQQTASVLMSAVAWHFHHNLGGGTAEERPSSVSASCAPQIAFGRSDTLLGRVLGRPNGRPPLGRPWHEWVEAEQPAVVVMSAGAHVYGHNNFTAVLDEVASQLTRFPSVRLWLWKTQQPGGCGVAPLTKPPSLAFWSGSIKTTHARCPDPSACHHNAHGTLFNWPDLPIFDDAAAAFWQSRPAQEPLVRLLDLRGLHLRPDAHVGSAVNISHDCLHMCVGPGPLDRLVPEAMIHALSALG